MQNLTTWAYRGYKVEIIVSSKVLFQANHASKLLLQALGHRLSLNENSLAIKEGNAPTCRNGMTVIATVTGDGQTMAWATASRSSCLPDNAWGQPVEAPIFRGSIDTTASAKNISLSDLLPQADARVLLIDKEMDRAMNLFGSGMAGLIRTQLTDLGFEKEAVISFIEYRDPYVRSPLVSKLLIDTAASLLKSSTNPRLKIQTAPPKHSFSPPRHIANDWPDERVLLSVQEEYGRLKGITVQAGMGDCGHGRFMELVFNDGRKATVILDQGFGAWSQPIVIAARCTTSINRRKSKRYLCRNRTQCLRGKEFGRLTWS